MTHQAGFSFVSDGF